MGLTYTPNINLALQQDKSDKLNWDAVTSNWQKIDEAFGSYDPGSRSTSGKAILSSRGFVTSSSLIGQVEQDEEVR